MAIENTTSSIFYPCPSISKSVFDCSLSDVRIINKRNWSRNVAITDQPMELQTLLWQRQKEKNENTRTYTIRKATGSSQWSWLSTRQGTLNFIKKIRNSSYNGSNNEQRTRKKQQNCCLRTDKSCMISFKKHNILSINVWKQEDQIFPLHPNWTRVTTFWCRDQD